MNFNLEMILLAMNAAQVNYLLIGGVNFMLRHQSYLTYDVDLWIEDTLENRQLCHQALVSIQAEWGPTDVTWQPVAALQSDWLSQQTIFCCISAAGALDIFRAVKGLSDWQQSFQQAIQINTAAGTACWCLSDDDMLKCQLALPDSEQKLDRIRTLQSAIQQKKS